MLQKKLFLLTFKLYKVGSPGVVLKINLMSLTTIQRHIFFKIPPPPSFSDISRVCKPMNGTPIDTNQVDMIQ